MPERIKINSGSFDELAALGVSDRTISALKKAHAAGMRFRGRADFDLLALPANDVELLAAHVDFGTPTRPAPFQILSFRVTPPPLVGYTVHIDSGDFHRVRPLSREGAGFFTYTPEVLADVVRFSVFAPSGARVDIEASGGNTVPFRDVPKGQLRDQTFAIRKVTEIGQAKPDPVRSGRITGRLLSGKGNRRLEEISIVFLVSTASGSSPAEFFAVGGASTETNGYFSTGTLVFPDPADADKLTAAKALIGLDPLIEKPVRLVPTSGGRGRLPERVILFVDDGGVEESGHACGLEFYQRKPLDEFSFYTVLRTTEPSIEAYTIADVHEFSLEDLFGDDDSLRPIIGGIKVTAEAFEHFLSRHGTVNKSNLPALLDVDRLLRLRGTLKGNKPPKGRVLLDGTNSVDWDDRPTVFQATEIAHGHLLHFKQEWFADGYSIGDLIYSLPLAPGQQKQIVVFDWDRRESAANTQQLDYQESLYSTLSRDRDVNEVARATLRESMRASSESSTSSTTWGVGGGALGIIPAEIPIPFGLLAGVSGGTGEGSSSAVQTGSRTATATSSQHVEDTTVQAANGVRSQRSTVVQTVSQGERFEVSAETVANYNHCHAMTVQYFEVLRHFQVQTRLADVQECLFVPLRLTPFDRKKALRWRESLLRCLRRRNLAPAFDALERVDQELSGPDDYYDAIGFPKGMFAEEELLYIEGELYIEFHLIRPANNEKDDFVETNWTHFTSLLGTPREFYDLYLRAEKERDTAFARAAGPRIAEEVLKRLRLYAVRSSMQATALPIDFTLLSEFQNRAPLHVSMRMKGSPAVKREDIDFVRLRLPQNLQSADVQALFGKSLKMIVRGGSLRYRTANLSEYLFRDVRINNDLTLEGDGVLVPTPLSQRELRKPRAEDVELANTLLRHLNDNIEYYHQCIWMRMDPQRRFMLLDGIVAPGRANGRSVASVVENRLIGIVGNSLVMPVAPGFKLDPNLRENIDLYEHYYEDPRDPVRLSLPTKGVFAEAVLGSCNSCEKIEEDRFWRWEQSPIPNTPTSIAPVTVPTPAPSTPDLQGRDFPTPMINIQNAPDLPAPQGFGTLAQLLSNPNLFRDLTGLSENQRNALAALQRAFQTTEFFGAQAAELTKLAAQAAFPSVDELKEAKKQNLIQGDKAREIYTKSAERRSEGDRAEQMVREVERVERAASESRISQQQATEILELLRELRQKETSSTLDKTEIERMIRESTRLEHEHPSGEKTRIDRTPRPQPRTVRFLVRILDTYGKAFVQETLPGTDVMMIVTSGDRSDPVTLQSSGTEFGAVMDNMVLDGGEIAIHILDETVSAGNIAFTGAGDIHVGPTATLVRVTAAMESRKENVATTEGDTHSEQILRKLDINLGGKLSQQAKVELAKQLEASASAEESLGISGGGSNTTTDTDTSSTTTSFEVRIPTGNLAVNVR